MPRPKFASVEEYLTAQPAAARLALEKVRAAVRKALPKAEEVISYQIPAYRLGGRMVIYFAGFKAHYSIFPAQAKLVEAFQEELAPYEFNRKGTIRFPLSERVPIGLIGRIAKFRAGEVAALTKMKSSATRANGPTRVPRSKTPSPRAR